MLVKNMYNCLNLGFSNKKLENKLLIIIISQIFFKFVNYIKVEKDKSALIVIIYFIINFLNLKKSKNSYKYIYFGI